MNWRYIVIIIILAAIVGGGILWLSKKQEIPFVEFPKEEPEKTEEGAFKLWVPGAEPDGIFPNTPTDINFTVLITGATIPPDAIQLEEVDINGNPIRVFGKLKDTGKDGDLTADDYIYSGVFRIISDKEGKLYYRATVEYGGQVYVSEISSLAVMNFPIGPAPSDPNFIVTDSKTGQKFYSNELLVSFGNDVSSERIRQIVSAENASVIGTIPSIRVFELRIPGDGTPNGVYVAIKAFQTYKEVDYAEPNYVVELEGE